MKGKEKTKSVPQDVFKVSNNLVVEGRDVESTVVSELRLWFTLMTFISSEPFSAYMHCVL